MATVVNRNANRRQYNAFSLLTPRMWAVSPQAQQLAKLIKRDGRVTRMTALHYGIANVTARVAELRIEGFAVDCEVKTDASGNEYGSWYISNPKHLEVIA